MGNIKVYEWDKRVKVVIVIILFIPVVAFLYFLIQNIVFTNKIEYIRENVKLGMSKSDIVEIIGNAKDSGYFTNGYELNPLQDSVPLSRLLNPPKKSYLTYNFGSSFFDSEDDLSLTFDSLDILIEIESPHFD